MEGNAIFILFPIITGAFFALNGVILMVIWQEIKSLRKSRYDGDQVSLAHGLQIKELAKDVEVIFDRLEQRRA